MDKINPYLRVGQLYDNDDYARDVYQDVQKFRRAAAAMGLQWADVVSKKRHQPLCDFRFMAMKHLRDKGYGYKQIGSMFAGRDHSTACYAVRTANELLQTDKTFQRSYTIFQQS